MDLDEIKNIIQQKEQGIKASAGKLEYDISLKSKHPAAKIMRKVLIENVLNILISMLFIYTIHRLHSHSVLIEIGLVVIVLAQGIFGFRRVIELNKIIQYSDNTKDFLNQFLSSIKSYIRILSNFALIIAPIGFIGGFFVGFSDGSGLSFIESIKSALTNFKVLTIFLLSLAVITVFIYSLVRVFYYIIYNRNIIQLKQLIKEINETNNSN
jgi:hypothetical protein